MESSPLYQAFQFLGKANSEQAFYQADVWMPLSKILTPYLSQTKVKDFKSKQFYYKPLKSLKSDPPDIKRVQTKLIKLGRLRWDTASNLKICTQYQTYENAKVHDIQLMAYPKTTTTKTCCMHMYVEQSSLGAPESANLAFSQALLILFRLDWWEQYATRWEKDLPIIAELFHTVSIFQTQSPLSIRVPSSSGPDTVYPLSFQRHAPDLNTLAMSKIPHERQWQAVQF